MDFDRNMRKQKKWKEIDLAPFGWEIANFFFPINIFKNSFWKHRFLTRHTSNDFKNNAPDRQTKQKQNINCLNYLKHEGEDMKRRWNLEDD